jgi:hypothetical protein
VLGITLAVIAALSQAATAWIGIQISRKEGGWRAPLSIALAALAVAGICATAWTAARTLRPVAVPVPATIDPAPTPPEPRASLRVTTREITTMGVDQTVKVSIGFENSGDRAATEIQRVQMVNFILSPYGEEEAFTSLRAELQIASGEPESVAPAGRASFTIDGPRLVAGDFPPRGTENPQVVRDSRPLLVAGIIRYRADDRSEATAEYCFYAMNAKVLVACAGHNN